MSVVTRNHPWLLLSFLALVASGLSAQGGQAKPASATKFDPAKLEKEDKEVAQKCAAILMRFGDFCKSQKLDPRAKEAYDRIISFYEPDHNGARMALGFKKGKDGWQEAKPPLQWKDKSTDDKRFKVQTEWLAASKGLAKQHRERGLKLVADGSNDIALGAYHLRCAITYDPFDRESHLALGHEEWKAPEGTSYYGPPEDIAFIKKMREVETRALGYAKKEYEITPVSDLPEELKNLGLEMHGAKSKHFTVFTRGTQENADNIVKWGERALDFMEDMIGAAGMKKLRVRERQQQFAFRAYLWTSAEKKDFIEKNPQIFKTREDLERTKQFGNINWVKNNRLCEVSQKLTPAGMHDHMVANVWQYAFLGMNDALKEGIMHAAGWYLLATTETRFGALPDKSETTSGPELNLPHSTTGGCARCATRRSARPTSRPTRCRASRCRSSPTTRA
jgi:hypothetical protein